MAGGKFVPENALSRKFLDPSKRASGLLCREFLYRKNRALTPEGGGKRTYEGGSKTPFWEGCHSWGFPPPSFVPPHGVLWFNEIPSFLLCCDPLQTTRRTPPLKVAFPLGNEGVLRFKEGDGFRKEGESGEGGKRGKEGRAKSIAQ